VGVAVLPVLVVRGHGQGGLGDGQGSGDEAERVVRGGQGVLRAGDRRGPHRGGGGGRGRAGRGAGDPGGPQVLPVLEPGVGHGERRVGVPVLPALVVGGHGPRGRGDGQCPGGQARGDGR